MFLLSFKVLQILTFSYCTSVHTCTFALNPQNKFQKILISLISYLVIFGGLWALQETYAWWLFEQTTFWEYCLVSFLTNLILWSTMKYNVHVQLTLLRGIREIITIKTEHGKEANSENLIISASYRSIYREYKRKE